MNAHAHAHAKPLPCKSETCHDCGRCDPDTGATMATSLQRAWNSPAYHHRMMGIGSLYWPQAEIALRLEQHLDRLNGRTMVVMSSRQTTKNHVSAFCQMRHLMRRKKRGGNWLRFAPTYKPQIVNSKDRLKRFCALDPITRAISKPKWREGYICSAGQASVSFLSADKSASVEGATADFCLDIDEAHKVHEAHYEEVIAPMTAWENAGRVLWGVGGSRDCLLHKYFEVTMEDHPELVLRYPWDIWAELRPQYAAHVEERRRILGEDNPIFKTQYNLKFVDAKGNFFTEAQIANMLDSDFDRVRDFGEKQTWVLVDIGGEDRMGRPDEQVRIEKPTQDSSFGVAVQFDWNYQSSMLGFPIVKVVDLFWRTGPKFLQLESSLSKWLEKIKPFGGLFDARGIGNQLASYWENKTNGRIMAYQADVSSVSDDCWDLLTRVLHGTVKVFRNDNSPEYRAFVEHLCNASYELFGFEKIRMCKPESDPLAHIDGAKALTYVGRVSERPLWHILKGVTVK